MAAGFRLPERVSDWAAAFADDFVVPVPSFWVDRFTYRTQNAQVAQVVFFNPFRALAHQRTDGCGGGVELIDLVLFADFPNRPASGRSGRLRT